MAEYESTTSEGAEKKNEKLLEAIRDGLKECIDDEADERKKMLDDLIFCTVDQWPADIRKERESDMANGPRPCLTADKVNQYIVQVVNDARQGKPGINVRPQDDAADIDTAKVLRGLVRNIEDQSKADIAYATAVENTTKMGLGFFRITAEYVADDSFDQDLFIKPLPNTFAVYLAKHYMPDGSDAKKGFIVESIPLDRFKQQYPGKKHAPEDFEGLQDLVSYWFTGETVTVVEYYCLERVDTTLYFLADGTTITREDYDQWPAEAGAKPSVTEQRASFREQLKWVKCSGVEVLDQRELPGKYIPIVEVVGRESNIHGKRYLWGLVRPAKDMLRFDNYCISAIAEKTMLAPKVPFIGAKGQFEGVEKQWSEANRVNHPYLEYNPVDVNGNALPRPERQGAMPIESALIQMRQGITQDVRAALGMFKAAVGDTESQQSGRALLALQKESDTGTYHFGANLGISIRHAGRILVDLIPHYYDTKRVVRIIGEDGEVQTAQLDPSQARAHTKIQTPTGLKSIYNPSVGKYDVSITVGPSYNTKRMEDQAVFVEMQKGAADPASAAILRYLAMRNSDSPGAQEAAKLLKSVLPPQALQALATSEPIPPQVQAHLQQVEQQMKQMQEQSAKLQQENVQLKAGAQVQMQKIAADQQGTQAKLAAEREQAMAQFELEKAKQAGELSLQRDKAIAEIELKRSIAVAEIELERLKITEGATAEVDAAIAKVKSMIAVHETKIHGELTKTVSGADGETKPAAPNMAGLESAHREFLNSVNQIVNALHGRQHKNVSMTMPDGRVVTAQVSMQ